MVESVLCYGSEICALREEDKRRILAVEMDYLRRSARVSRLQRVRNEEIRNRTSAQETVIQRIEKRGLRWFGHLMRMEDTRWPKRVFKVHPLEEIKGDARVGPGTMVYDRRWEIGISKKISCTTEMAGD
ncbi:uncharacterized protein LOC115885831 [Sitophilus oryzae]|uniref:Uncharacterized protein LOC115885831 n=1 Tax=Sitophilus oryzae TaxID=7048 RepID=A0A6J2YBS4_SITOR|nr:uncharacterized protein LOC115885831 [Sitophilus oryzae]